MSWDRRRRYQNKNTSTETAALPRQEHFNWDDGATKTRTLQLESSFGAITTITNWLYLMNFSLQQITVLYSTSINKSTVPKIRIKTKTHEWMNGGGAKWSEVDQIYPESNLIQNKNKRNSKFLNKWNRICTKSTVVFRIHDHLTYHAMPCNPVC